MSDVTLAAWLPEATDLHRAILLIKLAQMAEAGEPVGTDPSELRLVGGEASHPKVLRSSGGMNLAWQAPEVIELFDGSRPQAPQGLGLEQALFTLGLLGYWMYTEFDYLEEHGISALDVPTLMRTRPSLIDLQDVYHLPLGRVYAAWTSADPHERPRGTQILMQTIVQVVETGTFPTLRAEEPTGKVLYLPQAFITGRQEDMGSLESFLDLRGASALATVTLQMAHPACVLQVREVASDRSTTSAGTITVPKPVGYGGTVYQLTVMYDAERRRLYARYTDLKGHQLGGSDLGSVQ